MHIPVLLHESITNLSIQDGDIIIDGTFGGGGHSLEIIRQFESRVRLVCVDLDEAARARFADSALAGRNNVTFVHANFREVHDIMQAAHLETVNKVLLDLGTSTFQLLEDTRGFSFQSEAPLTMTFSASIGTTGFTAADIVNSWEASSIADIIYYYGEEPKARKIAHAIVAARSIRPIKTSAELARIIEEAVPRFGRLHPATKTFQALRIAVNDELQVLKDALTRYFDVLASGGRIAVITFHSLEDRIVKQWMHAHKTFGRVITKKPIRPGTIELQANSRARSAKLRVYEKN